eukprot:2053567-Pleurochrysis_carterae.AAC.1
MWRCPSWKHHGIAATRSFQQQLHEPSCLSSKYTASKRHERFYAAAWHNMRLRNLAAGHIKIQCNATNRHGDCISGGDSFWKAGFQKGETMQVVRFTKLRRGEEGVRGKEQAIEFTTRPCAQPKPRVVKGNLEWRKRATCNGGEN